MDLVSGAVLSEDLGQFDAILRDLCDPAMRAVGSGGGGGEFQASSLGW